MPIELSLEFSVINVTARRIELIIGSNLIKRYCRRKWYALMSRCLRI